jgi:hypothetical protein
LVNIELFMYFLATAVLAFVLGREVGKLEAKADAAIVTLRIKRTLTVIMETVEKHGLNSKVVLKEINAALKDSGVTIKQVE